MMKVLKNLMIACLTMGILTTSVYAKRMYDEKVVLGYSVAKLKMIKPDIELNRGATTDEVIKLVEKDLMSKGYLKDALKGKQGLFFVKTKKDVKEVMNGEDEDIIDILKVDRVYHLKNPQQCIIAMGLDFSDEELVDLEFIKNYFENNVKARAIISERIDAYDRNWVRKTTEMSVKGFVGLNNICPLNPFRPLVNAMFSFFTTDANDIYNKILAEVELLQNNEKHFVIFILPSE